jgi:hypothetical protein
MDWQSNFMKEHTFRWLVLGLMGSFVLFTIGAGISQLQSIHSVFEDSLPAGQQTASIEIGGLTLTKASIDTSEQSQTVQYVTVKDLNYTPSKEERTKILKSNRGLTRMTGLMGHPSFLVNKDNQFWKSQFYLEWGFQFGGLLVLGVLLIVITEINFRQNKKLFTKEIKRLFFGLFFLIFTGLVIEAVLYGRVMHFLNNQYYLGESLTGGISTEYVFLLAVFFWIITFFERAVPMQQEQDLTV